MEERGRRKEEGGKRKAKAPEETDISFGASTVSTAGLPDGDGVLLEQLLVVLDEGRDEHA